MLQFDKELYIMPVPPIWASDTTKQKLPHSSIIYFERRYNPFPLAAAIIDRNESIWKVQKHKCQDFCQKPE